MSSFRKNIFPSFVFICVGVILPLCRRYGKSFLSSTRKTSKSSQASKKKKYMNWYMRQMQRSRKCTGVFLFSCFALLTSSLAKELPYKENREEKVLSMVRIIIFVPFCNCSFLLCTLTTFSCRATVERNFLKKNRQFRLATMIF